MMRSAPRGFDAWFVYDLRFTTSSLGIFPNPKVAFQSLGWLPTASTYLFIHLMKVSRKQWYLPFIEMMAFVLRNYGTYFLNFCFGSQHMISLIFIHFIVIFEWGSWLTSNNSTNKTLTTSRMNMVSHCMNDVTCELLRGHWITQGTQSLV